MNGRLSISRPNDECVRVELVDTVSGLVVTRINIPMEEFAMCVTGMAMQQCEYDIYNNFKSLGKRADEESL